MTTMFVQLRRVVYLLVLLHCCMCVAYAEDGSDAGEVSSSNAEDVFGSAERNLTVAVDSAYEHILYVYGCMSAFKEKKKLCEDNSERAAAVAKKINASLEEIKKLEEDDKKWEQYGKWINDNEAKIKENLKEYENVTSSITDIVLLSEACKKPPHNLVNLTKQLGEARRRFLEVHQNKTHEKPEIMRLDKNSSITKQKLSDLTERLGSEHDELKPLMDVTKSVVKATRAVEDLRESLGLDSLRLMGNKEEWNKELMRREEERRSDVARMLEEAKAKIKEEIHRRVQEELLEEEKKRKDVEQPPTKTEGSGGSEEETNKGVEEAEKEQVTRAAEKVREEETKRAAKKATNGNDGSHSPALVHSPLLLILLSVLGCTLVC
ncbi:uncharacterized protein TM35_000281900 [Trypanosoma theileri]|uniref:Uncharacterized protein n=1 Tax=Trypanosoma theileri TaxID=67003 RepID=A0A1X0NP44_9TRYP|nr:uncharacterized protein TM35_000281900 [Trypanosoma theileri]ORC86474.1 hypothetical protein TM35_000281900 [Trypanosoma theileri]